MSHSWPATSRRISASSLCSLSEDYYTMEKETGEMTEQTKSLDSESMTSGDARTDPDSDTEKDEELKDEAVEKQARSLLSRLEDFKQSYNRTHGQVCEFFERARVVQKLGLLESSQASKLLSLSGDEAEDDDCNSIADCNYADGQKTTGMKRKLRKWRKVMRSALTEICPRLGLENQPDINPGLMKHIVDEVRNLKSQLAFQHNNIMQLAQKTELYLQDSQQKEQFIADLLQNCKGIRFDNQGMADAPVDNTINESASLKTEQPPLPASLDDIQFGRSKELLSILSLTPETANVPNAESVVSHPQNFTGTQRPYGTLTHRDSALDTNLTQLHGLEESQQGNLVRRDISILNASQDPRDVASSSSRTVDSSQHATHPSGIIPTTSCYNTGAEAAAASSSSSVACRNSISSGGLASSKKRNFFVSLGGSLTMGVLGVLALNTAQRRLCNNPEVLT